MRKTWWMCRHHLRSREDVYPSKRDAIAGVGCGVICNRRCPGPVRLRVVDDRKGGA